MTDPHDPVPADAHPYLTIDHPKNGCLTIDAARDPGCAILDVESYVEPQEMDRGSGMISLRTADMVELRDYLSALIRRDADLALQALAAHRVDEDVQAAARRILAGRDSGLARKVLADPDASETAQDAARGILATAYGRETP